MSTTTPRRVVRIGIGGPVGSGKTALVDALCKRLRDRYELGVVTNDIFTREDMEFLVRSEALPADRILGVQTGGCPHTAIREDASMNLDALEQLSMRHPDLDLNAPLLDEWAARVATWLADGTQVYFFCHCPVEQRSPALCRAFQERLARLADVPPLPWDSFEHGMEQQTLF